MTEYYVYVYQRQYRYEEWCDYACVGAIDIGSLSLQELHLFVEIMNSRGVCLIEKMQNPYHPDSRDYFVVCQKKSFYNPGEKYNLNNALEIANHDGFGNYQENLAFTLCLDVVDRVKALSKDDKVVWNSESSTSTNAIDTSSAKKSNEYGIYLYSAFGEEVLSSIKVENETLGVGRRKAKGIIETISPDFALKPLSFHTAKLPQKPLPSEPIHCSAASATHREVMPTEVYGETAIVEPADEPLPVIPVNTEPSTNARYIVAELGKHISRLPGYQKPVETTEDETKRWVEKRKQGMTASQIVDDEKMMGDRKAAINKVQQRTGRYFENHPDEQPISKPK